MDFLGQKFYGFQKDLFILFLFSPLINSSSRKKKRKKKGAIFLGFLWFGSYFNFTSSWEQVKSSSLHLSLISSFCLTSFHEPSQKKIRNCKTVVPIFNLFKLPLTRDPDELEQLGSSMWFGRERDLSSFFIGLWDFIKHAKNPNSHTWIVVSVHVIVFLLFYFTSTTTVEVNMLCVCCSKLCTCGFSDMNHIFMAWSSGLNQGRKGRRGKESHVLLSWLRVR